MYFRDINALLPTVEEHEMWIALEAASGILSQHDYDPNSWCTNKYNGCAPYGKGAWWNVTVDPFRTNATTTSSPLWSFVHYRSLNRLALRTKLNLTSSSSQGSVTSTSTTSVGGGALAYLKHDALGPRGDAVVTIFNPGAAQDVTIDLSTLKSAKGCTA